MITSETDEAETEQIASLLSTLRSRGFQLTDEACPMTLYGLFNMISIHINYANLTNITRILEWTPSLVGNKQDLNNTLKKEFWNEN